MSDDDDIVMMTGIFTCGNIISKLLPFSTFNFGRCCSKNDILHTLEVYKQCFDVLLDTDVDLHTLHVVRYCDKL